MIEIRGLEKSFGKQQVLKGLDLRIKEGEICVVLGPNGSGKTTLIKCILGLVVPDKGSIHINGENIIGQWNYRKNIGYMSQIARFPENLKVKELISMIKDIREQDGYEKELIDIFQLQPELNKPLGHLSGGTRQKVNAVIALMFNSPLLICDEPTAGLDPVSLIQLKGLIQKAKRNKQTILLITHIMSLVEEMADEIIFLLEGRIYFQGSAGELKQEQNEQDEHAARIASYGPVSHKS